MSDSVLSELLTAGQVAELLQMKRTAVEDYARRGLLPSLKLGRHRRFVRSDVETALVRLREESARCDAPPVSSAKRRPSPPR